MMRDLTVTELLGALVATKNLDLADTVAISEYATHVNVQHHEPAESLESALDMALDFFNDDPDTEAARVVALRSEQSESEVEHDPNTCPDCGGQMLDDDDMDQAIAVWAAIRGICDKYNYDMFADHDHGHGDIEEC